MRHEKKYPPYPVIDMKATGRTSAACGAKRATALQTYRLI